jgi:small GTP-binding protein
MEFMDCDASIYVSLIHRIFNSSGLQGDRKRIRNESMSQYKVVLLGEGRVGKTSLVSRFVNDQFSDTEVSTVQANMYNKKRVLVDGKPVDISIWDTAGQERFHALGPIYYRNANGAVLVYDITDADTFEKVKMWIRELKKVVGDNIQIVICGNKSDMEKDRDVAVDFAEKYARQQGAQHFSTSAKLSMNVTEAFTALAVAIVKNAGSAGGVGADAPGTAKAPAKKKRSVAIDLEGTGGGAVDEPSAGASSSSASKRGGGGGGYDYDDAAPVYATGSSSDAPAAKNSAGSTAGSSSASAPKPVTLGESGKKEDKKKKGGCCK